MRVSDLPVFDQEPTDPVFVQDPYPAYARMRALLADGAPAVLWRQYGFPCFPGADDVDGILRDRRFGREITHLARREDLGWPPVPDHLAEFAAFEAASLLEREPPVHTRLRRLVSRAFTARAVEALRPRAAALAHRLIDGFEGEDTVDLLPAFATPIPVTLICELLGTPVEAADRMLDWSHAMVAVYQHGRDRDVEDRAVAATRAFQGFMAGHVEAKRGRPGDDLLSSLIAAEEAGDRLSTDELINTAILLMNAGHEATVHGLGNAIRLLIAWRDAGGGAPAALFAEPERGATVVDELLRFDPPLHLFKRWVLADLYWRGLSLGFGDRVGVLLGAANRDPARFSEPDRFDPDRFAGGSTKAGHLTLGAGIHVCLGASLARLELAEALSALFTRLLRIALDSSPRVAARYHFRGLETLVVRPRG